MNWSTNGSQLKALYVCIRAHNQYISNTRARDQSPSFFFNPNLLKILIRKDKNTGFHKFVVYYGYINIFWKISMNIFTKNMDDIEINQKS